MQNVFSNLGMCWKHDSVLWLITRPVFGTNMDFPLKYIEKDRPKKRMRQRKKKAKPTHNKNEHHTASSSERTCSMGESVSHSIIIPPAAPCVFPASFSLVSVLWNLNFDNCSMSSFDAPSCFFLIPNKWEKRH